MHEVNKPKILIALFRLPYPATDGTRYKILHNVVLGLKKDFEVEFFVVQIKEYTQSDIDYMEREFGKVHLFHHSKIAYAINSLPALINGLPLQAQAFHFTDAQRWLDAHINEYSAVYIHEIRMTEFFINYADSQKARFLVDFNDAISMNYREGVRKMSALKKLFYTWEGGRVARYESKVLRQFKHFSVVSSVDKQYLLDNASMTDAAVDFSVINHGAPLSPYRALLDENKIFFLGSLDYEPNRDALNYFFTQLWPGLSQAVPDLECLIVGGGRIPPEYAQLPKVTFTGFVQSVFDTVAHCKALIAPIRFAGGTPSKIIESMGYGIPVITTPQGVAGIRGVEPGKNCIVVNEHEVSAWVSAITSICENGEHRTMIGERARQLIAEQYSQEAAQTAWGQRFRSLLG